MKKKSIFLTAVFGLALIMPFAVKTYQNKRTTDIPVFADDYYSSISQTTIDKGGETLQKALHSLINNAKDLGYDGLLEVYKTKSDLVPGKTDRIWDMYGGLQFTFDKQNKQYSKVGDGYNREHSIPQSWFSKASPMVSDLVHVVPTDGYVNNWRSNFVFGNVETPDKKKTWHFDEELDGNGNVYQTAGVSMLGTDKDGATVFEPDDQYKGDFARIYFYFATRYYDTATDSENARKAFSNSYPYLTTYSINLFKEWHVKDPVSEKELNRNDAIEETQGNRNPFVDHPEWANTIFDTEYSVEQVDAQDIEITDTTTQVGIGMTKTFKASVIPWNAPQNKTWSVSDNTILELKDATTGTFIGKKEGKVTITVTSTTNTSLSASKEIEVVDQSTPDPGNPTGGNVVESGQINAITDADFPTKYPSTESNLTISDVTFRYGSVANYGNGIQFKGNEGYIYNVTALENLQTITLTKKSSKKSFNGTIYFGNSTNPETNGTQVNDGGAFTVPEGCKFFRLATGKSAGYLSAIDFAYSAPYTPSAPVNPEPEEPELIPSGITLSNIKETYEIGDEFVEPTVTLHYQDSDETLDVTEDTIFEGFNSTSAATITITAEYESFNEEFDVVIVDNSTTPVDLSDPVDPVNPTDPEDPVDPEPIPPTPIDPEPVEPEPVEPVDPVDPEPVEPEPIDPEPVEPEPVDPEPIDPEPVDPADPVDPDPESPVEEKTPVSLTVSNLKNEYTLGEEFVMPNVSVTYEDGTTADVTDKAKFSIVDMTRVGKLFITVAYTENNVTVSTTFSIVIKDSTQSSGCSGNIVTTSVVLSTISLLGIALILIKKKVR